MKMIQLDDDRRRFQELVPFYANKTLSGEDLEFVENYLKQHPHLNAEVWFMQSIKGAVDLHNQECDAFLKTHKPAKTAVDRFRELHGIKQPHKNVFFDWFRQSYALAADWQWTPAFTLGLFCLFVGQTAVIFNLEHEASKYRDIANSINLAPHFKVTVNPKADFYALTELLRKNGCSVVSGPSQNGEIWIKLDEPAKSKQIKADMLSSGLVDEVISVSDDVE